MEFLVLIVGLIALWAVRDAHKARSGLETQLSSVRARLDRLEEALQVPGGLERAPAAPQAPPAPPAEAKAARPPDASPSPGASPSEGTAATVAPARLSTATLEERLGTRWAVWVGGASLALGGLLLVRFTIEQGVFGPEVRVVLAGLLSLVLIAAGEWFRRSERAPAIATISSAHIPSVLTAAGTASAFGTVYAAHALYGFIGPVAAFVLLGGIGVVTMVASALHGPSLAGLGLIGSLAAPLLVAARAPNPWPLVVYLAAVAATGYALSRLRHWLWLALAVVAGVLLWGLALVAHAVGGAGEVWVDPMFVHASVQMALTAAFLALEPHLGTPDDAAEPDWIATAALASSALVALLAFGAGRNASHAIPFAVVAMSVLALTAWRCAAAAGGAVLAGLVAVGATALWPGLASSEPRLLSPAVADVLRLPDNVVHFIVFAMASSLVIGLLATLRLERGRILPPAAAALYALAAVAPPLLALILVYVRVTQFDRSIPFALFALVLAADFYLAAYRFGGVAPAARTPATRLAAGAFAAGVAAAIVLASVMAFERGYLTVAFAITGLTTAVVAHRQRIPLLRGVVAALAVIVLGRLLWDPRIMGSGVGSWPVFNWLLLGYGVPAGAFLAAGHVLKAEGEDLSVRLCDALGVLFAALLAFYEIHHALNGGDPLASTSGHVEQGLLALISLLCAYILMRLDGSASNPVFRYASRIFLLLSMPIIIIGLGVVENPLFSGERIVGIPVFSSLLLAYLLPAAAALLLSRASRGAPSAWYPLSAAVLGLFLLFAYVTLEIRHMFQGETIAIWKGATQPEIWAYSAGWLTLGLGFLGWGIVRASHEARWASAALVVLAVVKVLLYDLTGTGGLWRALSVICLGTVLVGIGVAYQKLIFAPPRGTPAR